MKQVDYRPLNPILAEREACAKITESYEDSPHNKTNVLRSIAAAIRARPAPQIEITDAMIDRALVHFWAHRVSKSLMRAALLAAFNGEE